MVTAREIILKTRERQKKAGVSGGYEAIRISKEVERESGARSSGSTSSGGSRSSSGGGGATAKEIITEARRRAAEEGVTGGEAYADIVRNVATEPTTRVQRLQSEPLQTFARPEDLRSSSRGTVETKGGVSASEVIASTSVGFNQEVINKQMVRPRRVGTAPEPPKITEGFFTKEGQKQRLTSAGLVVGTPILRLALPKKKEEELGISQYRTTSKGKGLFKGALEFSANRPFTTASIATAVTGLTQSVVTGGTNILKGAGKASIGKAGKAALSTSGKETFKKGIAKAGPLIRNIYRSKPGGFAIDTGTGLAAYEVFTRGITGPLGGVERKRKIGKQGTQEEIKAYSDPRFRKAVAAGFQNVENESSIGFQRQQEQEGALASSLRFPKRIATNILAELPYVDVRLFKSSFNRGFQTSLQESGVSASDIKSYESAFMKLRNSYSKEQTANLLGAEVAGEITGRRLLGRLGAPAIKVTKGFSPVFFRVAPAFSIAGAVEGITGQLGQARAQQRKSSAKEVLTAGAFGAVTSPLLGGSIVALQATGRKSASGFVNVFANIADPLEKPGDITADILEGGFRAAGGRVVTPTFSFGGKSVTLSQRTDQPINVFGKTTSVTKTSVKKQPTRYINRPLSVEVIAPEATLEELIKPRKQQRGGVVVKQQDTPVPPINEPVVIKPQDTIKEIINNNVKIFDTTEKQKTESFVTATDTFSSFSKTPVVSGFPRILPPAPLGFPLFGGGSQKVRGKRKRYIDELAESQKLLSKALRGNIFSLNFNRKGSRSKSRGKRRKKRR